MAEGDQDKFARDARGRFGPGNPGGPGNKSRKRAELQDAFDKAITPSLIEAATRRLARAALEGSPHALQNFLDRAIGRPRQAPAEPEPLDIRLPEMLTPAACGKATELVMAATTAGRIREDVSKLLLDGIKTRLQALRESPGRRANDAGAVSGRLVATKAVWLLFQRFKKTGELPEDQDEARAVVDKVVAGFDVIPSQALARSRSRPWRASFASRGPRRSTWTLCCTKPSTRRT